jgi:hypothetical protein
VLATLTVPLESGFAEERLLRSNVTSTAASGQAAGSSTTPATGEWVRILRSNGFALEALHELYAPDDGDTDQY